MTSTTLPAELQGVLRRMSGALRCRDYRWWFGGQITSASGVMAQGVALSWIVLQETGNALWLSTLVACTWLPMLLLGPMAGAFVDRFARRRLLLGTQSALMAIAATLCVLSSLSELRVPEILGFALLSGVVETVDFPARQVYVVDLVGEEAVASAVGLWEVALNLSRVIGPGIAGALLVTSGAAACFGVNAMAYVAPLAVLLRMTVVGSAQGRANEDDGAAPDSGDTKRPGRGLAREGMRYAFSSPLFRVLLAMSAASGLLFGMGLALPPLVSRALHQGGGGYGAMMAAFGVGGLLGALLAAASPAPGGRRVRVLAMATAASVLATAWSPAMPTALAAMALTGLTSIWFIALASALAQIRCDPAYRGRIMSLWGMAMAGTTPFTGFAVGAVIQCFGARAGFSISGVCLGLAALIGWRALRDG